MTGSPRSTSNAAETVSIIMTCAKNTTTQATPASRKRPPSSHPSRIATAIGTSESARITGTCR
ncbi:hypothetical protein ACFQZ4_05680 [Catellatospora coxensis]